MAFSRPTLPQLIARIQSDITSRAAGGDAYLRRAFENILARVLAGLAHGLYGYLAWIARQAVPTTADEDALLAWATVFGVERKAATNAEGYVLFTGTNATVIPTGALVQRRDGTRYETTAEGVIGSGSAAIWCRAVDAGDAGNVDGTAPVNLSAPIVGINAAAAFMAPGASGGSDIEDVEDVRARLLQRIATPARGGNTADYEAWVRATPGVDVLNVWVYPLNSGAGTVDVAFTVDAPDVVPDSGAVAAAQAQLDDLRPIDMQNATAFAPTGQPLAVWMNLAPNTADIRAAVETAIEDFVRREAAPGSPLLISRLREAISKAAGEENHELITPTADIPSTSAVHLITFRANNGQATFSDF